MSQRAQVFIEDSGVYLYDHHGASDNTLQDIVRRALSREKVWDDPESVATNIFREMFKDAIDGRNIELDISKKLRDDIELLITISCKTQKITMKKCPGCSEETVRRYNPAYKYDIRQCSFESFTKNGARALRKVKA